MNSPRDHNFFDLAAEKIVGFSYNSYLVVPLTNEWAMSRGKVCNFPLKL